MVGRGQPHLLINILILNIKYNLVFSGYPESYPVLGRARNFFVIPLCLNLAHDEQVDV